MLFSHASILVCQSFNYLIIFDSCLMKLQPHTYTSLPLCLWIFFCNGHTIVLVLQYILDIFLNHIVSVTLKFSCHASSKSYTLMTANLMQKHIRNTTPVSNIRKDSFFRFIEQLMYLVRYINYSMNLEKESFLIFETGGSTPQQPPCQVHQNEGTWFSIINGQIVKIMSGAREIVYALQQ